jgi:hypothetical protein
MSTEWADGDAPAPPGLERAFSVVFPPGTSEALRGAVVAHVVRHADALREGVPCDFDGAGVVAYAARLDGARVVVSGARWAVTCPEPRRGPSGDRADRGTEAPSGLRIAVSGARRLHVEDEPEIAKGIDGAIRRWRPKEMIFGGARGADTEALRAARRVRAGRAWPRLVVVVPGRAGDQPQAARECAEACADEVVEMGLPLNDKSSYLKRNAEILSRADRLLAFWDGAGGGTSWTINEARRRALPVEVVPVMGY